MADPDVTLRFYRQGDADGIVDLLQASFSVWPAVEVSVPPVDHILWKLSSTEPPERYQVLAEADGKIVSCRLFLLFPFLLRGQTLFVRQGFDLAVHPDYQGHGILTKMWAFAREHLDTVNDFNFGVGAHPAALRMRATQGNITIGNRVGILARGIGEVAAAASDDYDVRDIELFDERIDAFLEEASPPFEFMVRRSKGHLNWRYCDIRGGAFTVKQMERDGQILGYAALRASRGKGSIADLLALPERPDVVSRLIDAALAHFRQAGVSTAECWLPSHHPYQAQFAQAGFRRKRRGVPLSYRHLKTPASELAFLQGKRAALHIMMGDTDLV